MNNKWTLTRIQQTNKLDARHKHKIQMEACSTEIAYSMNGNTSQADANDTNHAEATESSSQTKTAAQQRARNQQKTQCTDKDANKPEKQHDGHGNCAYTSARINIVVCSKYAAKFWSATFSHTNSAGSFSSSDVVVLMVRSKSAQSPPTNPNSLGSS